MPKKWLPINSAWLNLKEISNKTLLFIMVEMVTAAILNFLINLLIFKMYKVSYFLSINFANILRKDDIFAFSWVFLICAKNTF